MKPKTKTIIKTIIITLLVVGVLVGLYLKGAYEVNQAYQKGYTQGALYTFQTGNLKYIGQNNTIQTMTIKQACEILK